MHTETQDRKKITFWWNVPTPHMIPFFDALHKSGRFDITVVYEKTMPKWRRQSGWTDNITRLDTIFLDVPGWKNIVKDLIKNHRNSYYVFTGIGCYSKLRYANKIALKNKVKCFAAAEMSRAISPVRQLLLDFRNKFRYWFLGRHLNGVFAIASMAKAYYAKIGYCQDKLFDWMYFVERKSHQESVEKPDVPGIVFVGRMIGLKGIDTLLKALAEVERPWRLDLIGDGPAIEEFKKLADKLSISTKIRWYGLVSNQEVISKLPGYDVLVLPSQGRGDGWGCVINEAINAGCAVICSDRCGAKDLVQYGQAGEIFKAGQVASLTNTINRLLDENTMEKYQSNALEYRKYIAPENAIEYFEKVITSEYNRPTVPWVKKSSNQ